MLNQKVSAVYSPMRVTFDDKAVQFKTKTFNGKKADNPYVGLEVSLTDKGYKNGDPEIIFEFEDLESIDWVIDRFEEARSDLRKEQKRVEEEKNNRKFIVPVASLIVPKYFANPDVNKVLEAIRYYDTNKKINHKIIVDENLVIKDGYIGYLVAKYNDLKEIEVKAKNGIRILLIDGTPTSSTILYSNKVRVDILESTDFTDGAWFTISTSTQSAEKGIKIPVRTPDEAAIVLRKICKVFDANFDVHSKENFYGSRFMYDFMTLLANYGIYNSCQFSRDLK